MMLAISVGGGLLAGCGRKTAEGPPGGPGGPVEVGVMTIATTPVTLTQDLPGRVIAWTRSSRAIRC